MEKVLCFIASWMVFCHASEVKLLYQNLVIDHEESTTTIGWTGIEKCSTYVIEGFILDEILNNDLESPRVIFTSNTTSITIHNSNHVVNGSVPIYFRLTAVSPNGSACSDLRSTLTFYKFSNEPESQSKIQGVFDGSSCLDIPGESQCEEIDIIFQDAINSDNECHCYPGENLIKPIDVCACECGSELAIYNNDSGSVCFNHTNQPMDPILVHFLCQTNRCLPNRDCYIEEVVSSHLIHIVGPPYAITEYSQSNISLCFNSSSSPPYHVLFYTVNVLQTSSLAISLNTSDCLSKEDYISSINICKPYEILVTATNEIGTSDPTKIEDGLSHTCNQGIPSTEISINIIIVLVLANIITIETYLQ